MSARWLPAWWDHRKRFVMPWRRRMLRGRRPAGADHGRNGDRQGRVCQAHSFLERRKEQPFLPINFASLPETIFESELFGHKRGAFTGADRDKIGLLEAAGEGTVFLDEIGELTLGRQAKLLRVLNDGKYRPVGGTAERQSKARIITATNRDLQDMVDAGTFREDLLYRRTC